MNERAMLRQMIQGTITNIGSVANRAKRRAWDLWQIGHLVGVSLDKDSSRPRKPATDFFAIPRDDCP